MLVGLVVDAVKIGTPEHGAGVQEGDALALCDLKATLAQKNEPFPAALDRLGHSLALQYINERNVSVAQIA